MKHVTAIFILVFLFSGHLFAQEKFTLEQCIQIALENNNELVQKINDTKYSEYEAMNSFSSYLPSADISMNSGISRSAPRQAGPDQVSGQDPITGNLIYGGIIPESKRDFNSMNFSVDQNIFNGERIANIFQAHSLKEAAKYDLQSQKMYTILSVKEAFFNLIKQMKLEEVNKIAVQRSEDQLKLTEKMFELGSKARLDVFQAKVNLGNDRINLLTQQNSVNDANRSLNLVMGHDPGKKLNIQVIENFDPKIYSEENMFDTAIENQPLVKKGNSDIDASKWGVLRSQSTYLPNLVGFYRYSRSNSVFSKVYLKDYDFNWNSTIGLGLSMNLFSGFDDYLNVQKAKISQSNIRVSHENYLRNLKSRIKGFHENYNSYIEIININKENLEAAKEELRLAEERYRIGAGTSLEVREAQVKLTRAEETLIAAQYNALITQAQLETELGKIL